MNTTARAETRITVRVSPEHGTVDLLSATDPTRGAFTRVAHNHDASESLFSLFIPDGTPETAIARHMATVEDELQTVRSLCQTEAERSS